MMRFILRLILVVGGLYLTLSYLNKPGVDQSNADRSNVHKVTGTLVITSQPRSDRADRADRGTPVEPVRTEAEGVTGADRQQAPPVVYGTDLNLTDNLKFRVEYRKLGSQQPDSGPAPLDSDADIYTAHPPARENRYGSTDHRVR